MSYDIEERSVVQKVPVIRCDGPGCTNSTLHGSVPVPSGWTSWRFSDGTDPEFDYCSDACRLAGLVQRLQQEGKDEQQYTIKVRVPSSIRHALTRGLGLISLDIEVQNDAS